MTSARDFLVRGLFAGLFAGLLAFGVAYVIGEPSINAAIAPRSSTWSAGAIVVTPGMARKSARSSTDWCVLPVLPVRMPL